MPFPAEQPTIPRFLAALVADYGDRVAIILEDERLCFRDLESESAALATRLIGLGVGKGTRVGIWMPNGPRWLVAWLAAGRIGALTVPLNTFFRPAEAAFALGHSDVHTLLVEDDPEGYDLVGRLPGAVPRGTAGAPLRRPELPYLRHVVRFPVASPMLREDAEVDRELLAAIEAKVVPADALVLLYTSGSTGAPKAVVHTHGTLLRHSDALVKGRSLSASDVVWSPMPFFWVGGLVFALLGNLHVGATTLCERGFDPERTLRLLEAERATVVVGWPHFGKALLEDPTRVERDLSSLRAGNLPGLLPQSVVSPDPELRPNALGMTETAGPHTRVPEGVLPESLRATFGSAMPGLEHRVVDPDSGERVPAGEVGEIQVRGYSLMQGFYKLEREQTFLPDGFYATGDIGSFDAQGVLRFLGRRGEMIKTAGANVTPGEVETALEDLPGIEAAFVVGVPNADRGQLVVAAVVRQKNASVTSAALRDQLKARLAAYKVPRHFAFFEAAAELPFTDSGKLDRAALAVRLAAQIDAGEAD
ncbi:MAG: class I adenylate-forming enzyme family protein [Myxococcota bacterium]